MAEYIERDAVLKKAQLACRIALLDEDPEQCDTDFSDDFAVSVDDIVEIPAADVAPVVHGRWDSVGGIITCSECERSFNLVPIFTHYCPNCGARMMDGE